MKRASTLLLGAVVMVAMHLCISKAQAQTEGPDGHFYQVVLEPNLSWEQARIKAASSTHNGLHGYLATIRSLEEDQFIHLLRQQSASNSLVWIGGSQHPDVASTTDGWFWVNGEGSIPGGNSGEGYAHWQPEEPDESGHFLAIGGANVFGWSSESENSAVAGYVVEYPGAGTANSVSVMTIDPTAAEGPQPVDAAVARDATLADKTLTNKIAVSRDIAIFEFRREGDLSLDLPVFYSIHGFAGNGTDYDEIAKSIIIPAGETFVRLNIIPRLDSIPEQMETVGIRIEPSLILTPEAAYRLDPEAREAGAVIYDEGPPAGGRLQLVMMGGWDTAFKEGEDIPLLAALSFSNQVSTIDFWAAEFGTGVSNKLASVEAFSRTNELAFYRHVWTNPPLGTYYVTAIAHTPDPGSIRLASIALRFHVVGTAPAIVSIRALPPRDPLFRPDADYAYGYFEVRREGSTDGDLQVHYTVESNATAGSDYETLPGYVVIGSGRRTARINISAIDDEQIEPMEFVALTLVPPSDAASANYIIDDEHDRATVWIFDNDSFPPPTDTVLSVEATQPDAWEGHPGANPVPGEFAVRRTGNISRELKAYVAIGGTAGENDYLGLRNWVIFEPGKSEVKLPFTPSADNLVEGDETIVVELTAPPFDFAQNISIGYQIDPEKDRAVAIIHDGTPTNLPIVSVVASDPEASEPNPEPNPGQFTVRRAGPTNTTLSVNLFWGGDARLGSDYGADTNSVTFLPGQTEVRRIVTPFADHLVEGAETVSVQLITRTSLYANDPERAVATITIQDVPKPPTNIVVSIEATFPETREPWPPFNSAGAGQFTVRRTGSVEDSLRVYLEIGGTATMDQDYILFQEAIIRGAFSNVVTIPAGKSEVQFHVAAQWDGYLEGTETVVAEMVQPPATTPRYRIDPNRPRATVSILDEDEITTAPILTLEVSHAETSEPPPIHSAPGQFVIRRRGATNEVLMVNVVYGGTASWGQDYRALTNSVRLLAGQTEVRLDVWAAPDNLLEGDETVIAELAEAGTNAPGQFHYVIDVSQYRGTVTIHDAPASTNIVVSIETRLSAINEPDEGLANAYPFILRRTGPTNFPLIVSVEFAGTAILGQDYFSSNQVVIPAGAVERPYHPIYINADNLVEGDESIVAEIVARPDATVVTPRYTVHPEKNRAMTTIQDADGPGEIVVSIEARQPEINEPDEGLANAYPFTVRRTGPTNFPLVVTLNYGGTATLGLDYFASNQVVIPAGLAEFPYHVVYVAADNWVEGDETLVAEIVPRTNSTSATPPYSVHPEADRALVTIHDKDGPGEVFVSIEARVEEINEPLTNEFRIYAFVLRRTGPTNTPLSVMLHYGGTATLGRDYAGTNVVVIPPGAFERPFPIRVFPDALIEDDETIVAAIGPASSPQYYSVLPDKVRATVTLLDSTTPGSRAPTAAILRPANGAVFAIGDPIEVVAHGFDSDGYVKEMQLFANDELLATSDTNRLFFRWTNAPVGRHVLVAQAIDNENKTGLSTNVTILVRRKDAGAFVFRKLPDAYTPGIPFRVHLQAEPPSSASAYAVEDRPPQGWTVSNISHEGVFDVVTGKVKFGPFPDAEARTLRYDVLPPETAEGRREFAGHGSIDGVSYPIGGDQVIQQSSTMHPADIEPADFRMVLDEVTQYVALWKDSTNNTIPLNYVTRAAYLWQNGEAYLFDPSAGAPPLCWVPANGGGLRALAVGDCIRSGAEWLQPGISAEMELSITPPLGASAYAIEEQIPPGWSVASISEGGVFDPAASIIRWGVFFDGQARTLRYSVTPPANVADIGRLRGVASFDGVEREILGRERIVSVADGKRPLLERCEREAAGVRVTLRGEPGQVGVLQRSDDLANWEDVTTIFLPDGTVEYLDESAFGRRHLYYRLQVR